VPQYRYLPRQSYTVLQAQPLCFASQLGLNVIGGFLIADLKEDRKCVTFCSEVDKKMHRNSKKLFQNKLSVTMPREEHKRLSGFLNPDVGNFRLLTVNSHVVPSQVVTGETWRKVKTRQQRQIKCHFGERRQVLDQGMKHTSDLCTISTCSTFIFILTSLISGGQPGEAREPSTIRNFSPICRVLDTKRSFHIQYRLGATLLRQGQQSAE